MTTEVTKYQGNAVAEVRQFDEDDLATLKNTICKGASDSELKLFVATCQHTGLDPFMKQIHCVMRNTKDGDRWVQAMTIQVGIDGYRLIAQRTKQMQGVDGPYYTYDGGKTWQEIPDDTEIPQAARVGIWRAGVERPFVGVARWGAYVQTTREGKPNSVWASRGPEQLGKCAEALALRRAFPAELASLPQNVEYIEDHEAQTDWTPEQVRDQYVAEHTNVIDVAPETPEPPLAGDNPAHDEEPDPSPVSGDPNATRETVERLLLDCKDTWAAKDYGALYNGLAAFMPEGAKTFDPKKLPDANAAACLEHIRAARGEPVAA